MELWLSRPSISGPAAPDHHLDLQRLLSSPAQSSRDREQTHRATGLLTRSRAHPMPKRTRRNAQLLLSGSSMTRRFLSSAKFSGMTRVDARALGPGMRNGQKETA